MTTNEKAAAAAAAAQDRARELAAKAKPAAAQVRPLARSTQEAALRGLHQTRVWAAPHIEHTGEVLQTTVAPKVADALSSAARRIEPDRPRSRNWWTLSGILVIIAGAAAAAAVALRKRAAASSETAADEESTESVAPAAGPTAASSNADATRAGRTS